MDVDTHSDDYLKAKQLVLKKLSARLYASFEVEKILLSHQYSQEITDQIVSACQRLGYIDDADWIDGFVRAQQRKNQGPRMSEMKLRQKGAPEEMIEKCLSQLGEAAVQKEQIEALLTKRYRSSNLSDYKEKQKVVASLMRKGFDYACIQNALNINEF